MPVLAPFVTRQAPNGMVCSVDHLASEAGVAMLRAGGTAADAAIAANAVLAVIAPHMCGMGGDLFALVHEPGDEAPAALNASGRAGSGADPERLRSEGHAVMPMSMDIRCVPVPGCVDGWVTLHARYGRLPLADVLAPALGYAADGFPPSPTLRGVLPLIADLPDAADLTTGERVLRRPGVARALADVGAGGRAAYYEGEFGQALIAMGEGEYTEADLARSQADWVTPISVDAWGRTIWTIPPNSQGYLTLSGAWIAAGLDLPEDPDDPQWAHLTIEAARHAGFDRLDVLHDDADGHALVHEDRLSARRRLIDASQAANLGEPMPQGGGTMYLCAIDRDRMGVSLIQSNASGFGSGLFVKGLGINLHNRGLGFAVEAGHPAEYGPGRRPPHTLSPALVTGPGPVLDRVIGTMGGDSQPQVLLQLLARQLASRQSPATSIGAGRWVLAPADRSSGFDTWRRRGDVVVHVEGHAPAGWDDGLRAAGHTVERTPPWGPGFGHAHVIAVEGDNLAGAADPRALVGATAAY
jgi:gamma-glutamyltranspeptidase / glutathione hydrolase